MKTTILIWDRAEGKTHEMLAILGQYAINEDILIVGPNEKMLNNLPKHGGIFEEKGRKITFATFAQLEFHELYGCHPSVVAIDNADMLSEKTFTNHILPLLNGAQELIITGSDITALKFYRQKDDIALHDYMKTTIDSWKLGHISSDIAMMELVKNYQMITRG